MIRESAFSRFWHFATTANILSPTTWRKSIPQLNPYWLRGTRRRGAFSQQSNERPYQYHSWTFACVHRIVTNLIMPPRALQYMNGRERDELTMDHPLLRTFRKPNPWMCGSDLWEATFLNLLLPTIHSPGGQCFWLLYDSNWTKIHPASGTYPKYIVPYNDANVFPVLRPSSTKGGGNVMTGWEVRVSGNLVDKYEPDELIRIRLYNPYDILRGMSPYAAAEVAAQQDVKSDEYNRMMLDNYGMIAGVLSTEEDVDEEQARKYKTVWEEQIGGSENAGKVAVIGGGLRYQAATRGHMDMQFAEGRKDNRMRMQAVYGVPDSEIAIFESGMNRATAMQASRNFWTKSLQPLDVRVNAAVNSALIEPLTRGQFELVTDYSKVRALNEISEEQIAGAEKLFNMTVPPSEALRACNIPVRAKEFAWLAKRFVPRAYVDIEYLVKNQLVDNGAAKSTERARDEHPLERLIARAVSEDAEKRREVWQRFFERVLDPGEKAIKSVLDAFFSAQRNGMLDKIDAWASKQKQAEPEPEPEQRPGTLRIIREITVNPKAFLFDVLKEDKKLLDKYKPELKKLVERAAKELKEDYPDIIDWNATPKNIQDFIDKRKKKMARINTVTFNAARTVIGTVIEYANKNNLTPQETAKRLRDAVKGLTQLNYDRAMRIARTETGSISNMTRYAAFRENKVIDEHEWSSSKDELVRADPNHRLDGESRRVGARFSNGLRFPGDPYGTAENVINCRCTTVPKTGTKTLWPVWLYV